MIFGVLFLVSATVEWTPPTDPIPSDARLVVIEFSLHLEDLDPNQAPLKNVPVGQPLSRILGKILKHRPNVRVVELRHGNLHSSMDFQLVVAALNQADFLAVMAQESPFYRELKATLGIGGTELSLTYRALGSDAFSHMMSSEYGHWLERQWRADPGPCLSRL